MKKVQQTKFYTALIKEKELLDDLPELKAIEK